MKWRDGRRSRNIEDRRGSGGRVPGGIKVGGGMMLLLVVGVLLFGGDPEQVIEALGGAGGMPAASPADTLGGARDEGADFVSAVLADTEDTWNALFSEAGARYREPTLVLYDGTVQSACGISGAATGPFYCPGDQKVYLDLSFLGELQRLGARGDFAVAYVIAHEIGHHVQTITGTERQIRQLQQLGGAREANALSVRMELQADCYAGVWAHHADRERQRLEPGDIEEGLNAAAAVGDDRLQRMSGRPVQPDAFTHGTSAQRAEWFRRGYQEGRVDACDTFSR